MRRCASPSRSAPRTTNIPGKKSASKLTARVVKLSEKIKIAGRELDGAVVETQIDGPAVKYKGKTWHSPDVPGFQVKSEFDTSEGRLTSEVVEFEKK